MDEILRGLREYVNNGEYFTEARKWYNEKYIHPLCYRSMTLCAAAVFGLLVIIILVNMSSLFPLARSLQYSITVDGKTEQTATVTKADQIPNDPMESILQILLKDYVKIREQYDYDSLATQLGYVKNMSTRLVYKKFFNYLSIDDPESPVLRYQREAKRIIGIKDVKFIDKSNADVTFGSEAKDITNQVFENMIWVASINFDSDAIKLHQPTGAPFNFVVMDYKLKLIGDKNAKN